MKMNNVNLNDFAAGALAERFNTALQEVLINLKDPNTSYTKKRKLTIELTFKCNKERDMTMVDVVAKSKLCPRESISTTMLMDFNLNGEVIANELNKQISGQSAMVVNKDTGELSTSAEISEIEGLKIVR